MSAVDQVFQQLRAARRKAFIPFITAGDPDLEFTRELLEVLIASGSTLCEIGIPYSDPIADGPVIQASYTRALEKKIRLAEILQAIRQVSAGSSVPLVTMVSYAIVYRRGPEQFIQDAQRAGVAGAIVPDLPVDEANSLARLCRQRDFSLIQLVTPTTPRPRAIQIAEQSTGFLYYVSVTGITGERTSLPPELMDNVAWLRERTTLPICVGFGVSHPQQATLLSGVADGVIVGSAFVRRVAEVARADRATVLSDIGQLAREMVGAVGG